ncbi:D-amino acid dehydrogenase [Derxia gummosa]|uniref:D-amino acid dehydrogenase n=1 Tax=Derxia gummosa DSM 723 TaxID=1121388 RepID=A0A8B6X1T8_9BURK|nr:D-amino acid dehydrogenase [Derxia gummosa]
MRVIVLGAGIVGVATAWFLRARGCAVTVVDRQAGAACETSFANGGQISVCYAEPWANPAAPLKIAKWMTQPDAPLLFRPRLDWRQWDWCLRFLRECTDARLRANVRDIVSLASYSRATLQTLRAELSIDYDHLERGILRFFTDRAVMEAVAPGAGLMREFGVERRQLDAAGAVALEPALGPIAHRIVGADYTAADESGDVHRFTTALAERARAAGVEFVFDHEVTRLVARGGQVEAVELLGRDGRHSTLGGDAFVVALASHAPALLRPLGVHAPIIAAKGYSATFRVVEPGKAPQVSLIDDANKLVFSRFGDRLRVAGTVELGSEQPRALDEVRCETLRRRTAELFPGACDWAEPSFWTGLRPATPSNVPLIGRSRVGRLWLNCGHGTLGWTTGCGSGALLADLLTGNKPAIDFRVLGGRG